MPRMIRMAVVVLLLAVPVSARASTIFDSFTDPLPAHPSLPASGATILFLGSRCDGAACPPGTIVTNPQPFDVTEQLGPPGILAPIRKVLLSTYFEPNPNSFGVLSIDPADGGRLALETPGGPPLQVVFDYGDIEHPMNLNLRADGSDRLEIDFLAASTGAFGSLRVIVRLGRNGGFPGGPAAAQDYWITGPGTLVVPYADLVGLEDFDDNVGFFRLSFIVFQGGEKSEFVVGEVRTASTPIATETSSWGRIKGAYRH